MAISALHPTGVVRCDRGHPQVQANLYWQTDKRDGVTRPGCRLCRNERAQKARQQARRERSEAKARTCPSGHLIFGDNAARLTTSTGKVYVACRTCRTAAVARSRAKRGGESVAATTMHVPRSLQPDPEFGTIEVWKALPKELRQRVAGFLMDDQPIDPLVAAVIRRAARARVWNRFGVDAAAIAFIEALVEQSRHSTSPRLRIDRVLGALLG